MGDVIVVNGKSWPYLNVEQKNYRFLFLNGSNARAYGRRPVRSARGVGRRTGHVGRWDRRRFPRHSGQDPTRETPQDQPGHRPGGRQAGDHARRALRGGHRLHRCPGGNPARHEKTRPGRPTPSGGRVDRRTTANIMQFRVGGWRTPRSSRRPTIRRPGEHHLQRLAAQCKPDRYPSRASPRMSPAS